MHGTRLVALLRAVNLGPTTQLAMARVREVAEGLGHRDVATHARSGNLVLTAVDEAHVVAAALSAALTEAAGFPVPVVVRTRDELAEVLAERPFGPLAADPSRDLVMFLDTPAAPEAVTALLPADLAPEAVHVAPRHIHVWSPAGVSRSRALQALARRGPALGGTVRNRRTLEAILALCDAGATED